jgi:hypothetical protein
MPPQRKTSGAAVASLIFGILGCVPLLTGLLAIICGIIGLRTTRNPAYSGRGMAVAGLILGLVSFLVWGAMTATSGVGFYVAFTHTKEARAAANQLARDLAAGDVNAAQARCSAQVKREELQAVVDKIKPWGPLQDTTMPVGSRQTINGVEEAFVMGAATFAKGGSVPYAVGFRNEGGTLKVTGFVFTTPEGGLISAGTEPDTDGAKKSSDESDD